MKRIISAVAFSLAASFANVSAAPVGLADNAPDRYIVVKGDTLWAISGKFLKEPWRWPEIWRMNKEQIKNPHRIYPGDVVVLDYDANGDPMLRLLKNVNNEDVRLAPRAYSESINQAIPPIPPNVIEPFISQPLIVEENELADVARIVATKQDRVFMGNGDTAYVQNADPQQKKWQVYRRGKSLKDPDDPKKILGYEAFYLGTATQVRVGEPATFEITMAKQEMGVGDRLIPAVRPPLVDYIPHKPEIEIDGKVIGMYGGVTSGGRNSIISISRGSQEGVEVGHVLKIERNRVVKSYDEDKDKKFLVAIPAEKIGVVFVFRTFDHISYGLIMNSDGTVEVNDFVRTP